MISGFKLIFAAPLIFLMGGSAFAQPEHRVVQHGKDNVCPLPPEKKETAVALPVLPADTSVFIPNSVCIDEPDFLPHIGNAFIPHDYSMRIFDRWGNLLYTNYDAAKGWDGRPDGKSEMLPEGSTCYYLIHFTDQKGIEHKLQGYVMVSGFCHCG